jgi:hypothetical protein
MWAAIQVEGEARDLSRDAQTSVDYEAEFAAQVRQLMPLTMAERDTQRGAH